MTWSPTTFLSFPTRAAFDKLNLTASDTLAIDPVDALNTGKPYFVNIRYVGEMPEALARYVVPAPEFPKQVFAGDELATAAPAEPAAPNEPAA